MNSIDLLSGQKHPWAMEISPHWYISSRNYKSFCWSPLFFSIKWIRSWKLSCGTTGHFSIQCTAHLCWRAAEQKGLARQIWTFTRVRPTNHTSQIQWQFIYHHLTCLHVCMLVWVLSTSSCNLCNYICLIEKKKKKKWKDIYLHCDNPPSCTWTFRK